MSSLKDEVVVASDQYFKRAEEYVAFFYLNLDFNLIDLFKMVWDSQLADSE